MQVSYGKLTGRRRWWVPRPRDTTSHNRTLSRGSTRSETAYFGGWKKIFTSWAYKSLSQLLGEDFIVNFATTYTRVYTVSKFFLSF